MPIRFRCAYCNQLLGIARRKAGQVVRCPTCAGQVVVPNPEGEEAVDPPPPAPPLFERNDFSEVFRPPAAVAPPQPVAAGQQPLAPAPAPTAGPAEFDVERYDLGGPVALGAVAPPGGIVLSPLRATVLTVAVIVAVALAFGAGVLVGRFAL
jgi:phage FluMu protein Com